MKPEDLKSPFTFKNRKVLIEDRIWYVPDFYHEETFTFPGWNSPVLFSNNNPIHLEYCSGNGAWIVEKALQHPEINWVAVEIKFERVRKIWSKLKNHQLSNLIVICGDGREVTSRYFPEGTLSEIYINFPDPWPKKRHIKHRIIQPEFLKDLNKVIQKNGHFIFVTDDKPYSEWLLEKIEENGVFKSCYPAPHYLTNISDYGASYFEQLWKEKGRILYYHKFQNK